MNHTHYLIKNEDNGVLGFTKRTINGGFNKASVTRAIEDETGEIVSNLHVDANKPNEHFICSALLDSGVTYKVELLPTWEY